MDAHSKYFFYVFLPFENCTKNEAAEHRKPVLHMPALYATLLIAREQEVFLTQLLDIGFFHGDPHPGNLLKITEGILLGFYPLWPLCGVSACLLRFLWHGYASSFLLLMRALILVSHSPVCEVDRFQLGGEKLHDRAVGSLGI